MELTGLAANVHWHASKLAHMHICTHVAVLDKLPRWRRSGLSDRRRLR